MLPEVPAPNNARPGFRLIRVEVLNWGTFHKQVWGLDVGGHNALVTACRLGHSLAYL